MTQRETSFGIEWYRICKNALFGDFTITCYLSAQTKIQSTGIKKSCAVKLFMLYLHDTLGICMHLTSVQETQDFLNSHTCKYM